MPLPLRKQSLAIHIPGPRSPSGARKKVCSLIGATWKVAWNGEGSVLVRTIKKRKEGERKKRSETRYRKAERRDNRSSTGRQNIPKDPWRIGFSHTRVHTGEEEVAATIKWKKWKYVCPIFLSSQEVARQCVDRKQTSGNDRGRQCAFKTRQTVICHVFHAL